MRILMIHEDTRGYGRGGGAESFLRDQMKALKLLGHKVEWFHSGVFAEHIEAFKPDMCQVMTVHTRMGFGPVRWLQKEKYPHVWALMDYWPFCGGRMLLRRNDEGCAAIEGICDGQCDEGPAPGYYLGLVNASPVMALNPYTADIYRRNGLRCDYIISLGIEYSYFVPDPAKREPGRIVTMSAWPEWPTKGMHILKAALRKTGYEGHLITGMPRDRVLAELQRADIFVFPSTYQETWGLCLTEAMSCGCACIASDVCGPRAQIEHGVNGLLVPPRDVGALAEALRLMVEDEALRRRLSEGARRSVEERMTLRHMGEKLEGVYRSVLSG